MLRYEYFSNYCAFELYSLVKIDSAFLTKAEKLICSFSAICSKLSTNPSCLLSSTTEILLYLPIFTYNL